MAARALARRRGRAHALGQFPMHIEQRRGGLDPGRGAIGLTRDQSGEQAAVLIGRQVGPGVVMEARVAILALTGQGDPGLHPVHGAALGSFGGRGPLRMDDALAGGHPVHLAGANGLGCAGAVPMDDLALEQIGQGRKADMRVRADIDRLGPRREFCRPHLVEEDEGTDHAARVERQDPSDLKAPEILATGVDHHLDHLVYPLVPLFWFEVRRRAA